jgi:hypothetical protein
VARPRPSDVQAAYFVATGVWPIVHLGSFIAVTGPKHDRWLVQTFGGLIAAIGLAMLASRDVREASRFGGAAAVALTAAEVAFIKAGRIRPIYLADAALELAFAATAARRLVRRPGPAAHGGNPVTSGRRS